MAAKAVPPRHVGEGPPFLDSGKPYSWYKVLEFHGWDHQFRVLDMVLLAAGMLKTDGCDGPALTVAVFFKIGKGRKTAIPLLGRSGIFDK